jgi:hypothetical protein
MDANDQITWGKVAVNATLAVMGGVVRELTHGKGMSIFTFIGGGFVGMFCGILAYCVCHEYGLSQYLTAAVTGLAGYMGSPLLDFCSAQARKVIKRHFSDER